MCSFCWENCFPGINFFEIGKTHLLAVLFKEDIVEAYFFVVCVLYKFPRSQPYTISALSNHLALQSLFALFKIRMNQVVGRCFHIFSSFEKHNIGFGKESQRFIV